MQSWQGALESSSVRHGSWLSRGDEKDISFGIDAVRDDEREEEGAKTHHQGDKLKLFAGDEEYAGSDIFPAALSPCGVFSRAPLTQFESRGQGSG